MILLKDTNCSSTKSALGRAVGVAEYYGFVPLESLPVSSQQKARAVRAPRFQLNHRDERALLPLVREYAGRGLCFTEEVRPSFVWLTRNETGSKDGSSFTTLSLHIVGIPTAFAEAILISVMNAIAEDLGIADRIISINSIGSPDSSARYVRELTGYLRRNINELTPTQRARLAADPMGTFVQLVGKNNTLVERAPQSMEFLNEEERQHLWSVLEYLETAGTAYELNPFILGSRECWTHTLFEAQRIDREAEKMETLARGGRYDAFTEECTGQKLPAVGMNIRIESRGKVVHKAKTRSHRPSLYFAHLGIEAKRRIIPVLEQLRIADIPVYQSLAHERIAEQIESAKQMGVPFVLVMGHKEAVENTVLVRDMATSAQIAVPVEELTSYLKRRRIPQKQASS